MLYDHSLLTLPNRCSYTSQQVHQHSGHSWSSPPIIGGYGRHDWHNLRHTNNSFFSTSHWFFSFRARFSLFALIVFIIACNFLFFYLLRVTSDIVLLKQFPICFLCLVSCSTLSTIMNTIFI